MKLWMLTEISGESREATAFIWAEDPGEARWLLREKTGGPARVCMEVQPQEEAGMLAWSAFRAMRGTPSGAAAVLAACMALAVVGVAAVVSGALVSMGDVR